MLSKPLEVLGKLSQNSGLDQNVIFIYWFGSHNVTDCDSELMLSGASICLQCPTGSFSPIFGEFGGFWSYFVLSSVNIRTCKNLASLVEKQLKQNK